jgi:hypothetical protein
MGAKKVSSFLKKRREERLNLSQMSNDCDASSNTSLLNLTDGGFSFEDRKMNFAMDLEGSKTQRISIIEGIEEFTRDRERPTSFTDRARDLDSSMTIVEEDIEHGSKRKKSRNLGILAISAGLIAGGLIYLIKKKRLF